MKQRIKDFFIKLISVKILVFFSIATILLWYNKIPWYGWLIASGFVFAARTTEKLVTLVIKERYKPCQELPTEEKRSE